MSSKAPSSRQISILASQSLKIVGIIITLAALLDMIVLPLPYPSLSDEAQFRQWQIGFVTQMVDRGIVPMVGLALFFTGSWVDSISGTVVAKRKALQDLKFWAAILASLLGLLYLLSLPLHLINVRASNSQELERIQQEASQAESQLGNRLLQEAAQQRQQIDQLLQNEALLNRAKESGQVTQEQVVLLERFRGNPEALDDFINQRVDQLQTQLQTDIGVRREREIQNINIQYLKSGLRIGLSSLLLTIGYLLIGSTGLKQLGQMPEKRIE
jgi:hypothetical protein